MKRISLLIALIISFGAHAESILVDVTPQLDLYIDPATMRKSGDITTVWEMSNLKKYFQSKGRQFKSMRIRTAYDCKNERRQSQYIAYYSEFDAQGVLVEKDDFGLSAKWDIVDPESTVYLNYLIACKNLKYPKELVELNKKFQKNEISESEFESRRDNWIKNSYK